MAKFANLDGTLRENFQIGPEDGTGFRRNANGELALYDPVAGLATLVELMAGGGTSIIETKGILTTEGGIVYAENDETGVIDLVIQ